MSALVAAPSWAEMEYETRCRLVWKLSHQGLTIKQIAFDLGCQSAGHVLALARAEGIIVNGRKASPDWPTKDSPGWCGTSLDTVRRRNWQLQVEGARRTRIENEIKDRAAPYLGFQTDIPTNNTDPILGSDTSTFHGAGLAVAA